jgi:formylglycine-generating enzyme required for sulfatase activity
MQTTSRRMCGILAIALVIACCSSTTGPVYVIEEDTVITLVGTEHVQVLIPGGVFTMGSQGGPDNERPPHEVTLDAFYIDKYEVSNAQYLAFVEATGSEQPQFFREEGYNQLEQPVVGILWSQARDYCEWANLQLPTEAQWELAAAGTDGRVFPWGSESADDSRGNFNFSSGPKPVGSYPDGASPYGALDMAGNVWEWTLDEYEHTYYVRSPSRNPVNLKNSDEGDGPDRTLRGGGWFSAEHDVRVSVRSSILIMEERVQALDDFDSNQVFARIGLRCARDATGG